jgi:hypothetical protein
MWDKRELSMQSYLISFFIMLAVWGWHPKTPQPVRESASVEARNRQH